VNRLRTLACTAAVLLALLAEARGQGTDKPADKGIDPATVAAYEQLGGVYGGWVECDAGRYFQPGAAHG
jgi:hypothetical protein